MLIFPFARKGRNLTKVVHPDPAARVPDGVRVYAFGDVHGCDDLLRRLLPAITDDAKRGSIERMVLVGLGDYIDRGPNSRVCIELLLREAELWRETVFLRGNHEQTLLDFIENPERIAPMWFEFGGTEFMKSYGIDIGSRKHEIDFRMVRGQLVRSVPLEHLRFVQRTLLHYEIGDYFFVHAGVRLNTPLSAQVAEDFLWIRNGFSDRDDPFEKVVVHGHTPVELPFLGRHRINLDTGAYATGRLTCIALEGASRRLIEI